MSKSSAKYRPSLSAETIAHLVTLVKADLTSFSPINKAESTQAIAVLAPFMAKIENAGIVPAYTVSNTRPTLAASLGMISETSLASPEDKEVYWEQCYNKYVSDKMSCSYAEIQAAYEHMYLNDLLTPEQAALFEQGKL